MVWEEAAVTQAVMREWEAVERRPGGAGSALVVVVGLMMWEGEGSCNFWFWEEKEGRSCLLPATKFWFWF